MDMEWSENWKIVSDNIGGGQGDCYIVESKSGASGSPNCFLKVLRDIENKERRRRFFIETTIYQSVDIHGIPKIIETNADKFEDKNIKLYYISNFLNGMSLEKLVTSNPIAESKALLYFKQLILILSECHSFEIVHRDIKPENIIIDRDQLFLVDFGIAFRKDDEFDNITKLGQEVGNRFLRLPEMSAGSFNKRDIRSDLSFAVGIAFYMLTGTYPRKLINEMGQFPHQDEKIKPIIKALKHSSYWNLIFDKGFQQPLANRWSSTEEILGVIKVMESGEQEQPNYAQILETHAGQINHEYLQTLQQGLYVVYNAIDVLLNTLIDTKAKGFIRQQQRWVYQKGATVRQAETRVYVEGRGYDLVLPILFKSTMLGDEVIGYISIHGVETEIFRNVLGEEPMQAEIDLASRKMEPLILSELVKLISP